MRDATTWRTELVHDLNESQAIYGPLSMSAARLLDTELVLTLLVDHLPGQDPTLAWAALNGYAFPAFHQLPEESQRALTIARLRLPELLGRYAWQRNLQHYQALVLPYPLYRVEGRMIQTTGTAVLPERMEHMRAALATPPAWRTTKPHAAPAGIYHFYLKQQPHEVEIPARVAALAHTPPQALPPTPALRRPLRLSFAELEAEADWMDSVAPTGSPADQYWGDRMRALRPHLVSASGLTACSDFTIDGLFHLVGMLGSGKSTFFSVLAVHLARLGQRVTLVLGDVATLLQQQAVFEVLRQADPKIVALPFIGHSSRVQHLNRLVSAETRRNGPSLSRDHSGYAMLSTVCALDGLRRDVEPIPAGQEPCRGLYRVQDEAAAERFDCPFLARCPVHTVTQHLFEAQIWLTTPASLLASGPQAPLLAEDLRYAELIMRASQVILVDEADLVQMQCDAQFAQVEVLVGKTDSWLDQLATQVARKVYHPGRFLIGRKAGIDRWLTAHTNTQRAVDRLLWWLREDLATRQWLRDSYFSGQRLLQRVEQEMRDQLGMVPPTYRQACDAFARTPLVRTESKTTTPPDFPPEDWERTIQAEILLWDGEAALAHLTAWEHQAFPLHVREKTAILEAIAHHLRLALLVSFLDHALQNMLAEWSTASQVLDLSAGSGGLLFSPSDSLARLVPEAPMGAILGFQYFDPENRGDGDLRFFRLRGLGRAFLYQLAEGYRLSDGQAGPHVLLTSGTSVAPGSWRYDLHIPPNAILLPAHQPDEKSVSPSDLLTAATGASGRIWCKVDFLSDPADPARPLAVSGRPPTERIRSLRQMVAVLALKRGFQQESRFDEELAALPDHRRRILLVVGSYTEADEVAQALTEALGVSPGEEVVALVREQEGELVTDVQPGTLLRSLLPQFAELKARFLVAPLQAIERGHNILVGQEGAIGSVYFLIRPLPVPGDPYTAVQRLNAWAYAQSATMRGQELTEVGKTLREEARKRWDEALGEPETYFGTTDREALLWTQLVLVWQCIGRLLRGGASARVHFVDAKWAEVTSGLRPGARDTEATSMLVGFRSILHQALNQADPAQRNICSLLYGPLATALESLKEVGIRV